MVAVVGSFVLAAAVWMAVAEREYDALGVQMGDHHHGPRFRGSIVLTLAVMFARDRVVYHNTVVQPGLPVKLLSEFAEFVMVFALLESVASTHAICSNQLLVMHRCLTSCLCVQAVAAATDAVDLDLGGGEGSGLGSCDVQHCCMALSGLGALCATCLSLAPRSTIDH